jgi:hypothetical protein
MDKRIKNIADTLEIQCADPSTEYDPYMIGLANGMELCLAELEQREAILKQVPSNFKYIISKMFSK